MRLSKEEYLAKLQSLVGDEADEDTLAIIEDFTDTYTELESAVPKDNENWEQKYTQNDEMWRKKYRDRFFSAQQVTTEPDEPEVTNKHITCDDLFK